MAQKQKQKTKNYRSYWRFANKLMMVLIVVGGIYFIININSLSIKGFILRELKDKVVKLNNENKNIELKIMELESYKNLNQRAEGLEMVKVDKIDYIIVVDEAVAVK